MLHTSLLLVKEVSESNRPHVAHKTLYRSCSDTLLLLPFKTQHSELPNFVFPSLSSFYGGALGTSPWNTSVFLPQLRFLQHSTMQCSSLIPGGLHCFNCWRIIEFADCENNTDLYTQIKNSHCAHGETWPAYTEALLFQKHPYFWFWKYTVVLHS